jgi:hypothetical protein
VKSDKQIADALEVKPSDFAKMLRFHKKVLADDAKFRFTRFAQSVKPWFDNAANVRALT